MGQNFIACDRDQVLLLAPDLQEWLPVDHLARFVIAAVGELDLDAVYAYYRRDGLGRPAHEPAMMVALLLYSYAVGVRSARQIERRCVEDVACRVITANRKPDHATVARFRVRHQDALSGLFLQVLELCKKAGMVRVGTVAVDSTKFAANASAAQNRTLAGLRAEVQRIFEEAAEIDAREDELYGERRGDELPAELADPRTRAARIRELLDEVEAEIEPERAKYAEVAAKRERGEPVRGRRPKGDKPYRLRGLEDRQFNLTDPDSGLVRTRTGFVQGYNVQTVVGEGQVILATGVSRVSTDQRQLAPMVEQTCANLASIGHPEPVGAVLADSGYWNVTQVRELTGQGRQLLIPPKISARRPERAAPEAREMLARLETDHGKHSYQRRQHMIEPVFGQIKHNRGIQRLLRRGRAAVQAEIDLIAATHNLLKLRIALQSA